MPEGILLNFQSVLRDNFPEVLFDEALREEISKDLRDGALTKLIYVSQHTIRDNDKKHHHTPPINIRVGDRVLCVNSLRIKGETKLVYAGDQRETKALESGHRVWMETRGEIEILDGGGDGFEPPPPPAPPHKSQW